MGKEVEFYKTITVVEFRAFDRDNHEFFFDATPEQITAYIFKNICDTAVINTVTEFEIANCKRILSFQKKQ